MLLCCISRCWRRCWSNVCRWPSCESSDLHMLSGAAVAQTQRHSDLQRNPWTPPARSSGLSELFRAPSRIHDSLTGSTEAAISSAGRRRRDGSAVGVFCGEVWMFPRRRRRVFTSISSTHIHVFVLTLLWPLWEVGPLFFSTPEAVRVHRLRHTWPTFIWSTTPGALMGLQRTGTTLRSATSVLSTTFMSKSQFLLKLQLYVINLLILIKNQEFLFTIKIFFKAPFWLKIVCPKLFTFRLLFIVKFLEIFSEMMFVLTKLHNKKITFLWSFQIYINYQIVFGLDRHLIAHFCCKNHQFTVVLWGPQRPSEAVMTEIWNFYSVLKVYVIKCL